MTQVLRVSLNITGTETVAK